MFSCFPVSLEQERVLLFPSVSLPDGDTARAMWLRHDFPPACLRGFKGHAGHRGHRGRDRGQLPHL